MIALREERQIGLQNWCSVLGILLLTIILLQGCAGPSYETSTDSGVQGEAEVDPSAGEGPAASLYLQSRQALEAGDSERAEMILERALRIEPANPLYWHAKARLRFQHGDYLQTIELCRKSNSLAGSNRRLRAKNDHLIEQAREQM
ncbi:MAG TPA: tetratricopeptide repeat protein [Desulfopila sp.]|nr:tetratricopeptide repeat protein [Desulfopila sp.]